MNSIKSDHVFRLCAWVCLMIILTQPLKAQLSKKYKGYQQAHYNGLRYGLFKPEGYNDKKSYPLIVYLHGSTDTVSRDLSWYQPEVQKQDPCFVISPKTTEANLGWGHTWTDQHTPAMERTLSLVDSIVKKYNIDPNRLYIYGISMGAFGVFSVLTKEPEKFAGAYAVCGGADEKVASKIITPLWIFHGDADDIVPVRLSRNIYNEMVRLGKTNVRYTEYPGVRHNSWENVSREETLNRWLLGQQKGISTAIPERVTEMTAQFVNNTARLTWKKPQTGIGNDIWFYKVFKDNQLIAEVDGNATSFTDQDIKNKMHVYQIVSVSYLFKQSKPSESVQAN